MHYEIRVCDDMPKWEGVGVQTERRDKKRVMRVRRRQRRRRRRRRRSRGRFGCRNHPSCVHV
jgi:hypothetical protein